MRLAELSPAADDAWLLGCAACDPASGPLGAASRESCRHLRAHRIRRLNTTSVAALQQPRLPAGAGRRVIAVAIADRVVGPDAVRLLVIRRQRTDRQIERALADVARRPTDQPREHRDVHILRSLPGAGRTVTATMLTEAAGPLAARDYALLRAPRRHGTGHQAQQQTDLPRPECVTRCKHRLSTGALSLGSDQHSTRRRRPRLLRRAAPTAVIITHVPCAASPIDGSASSLRC